MTEVAYRDQWLTVWRGDCRDVMRQLPEASVQTVVTSPPYWGLRDYGIEPSVWGGDPDHEHAWGEAEGYTGHRGKRGQVPQTKNPKVGYPQTTGESKQAWCSCGAWLGVLGLEPSIGLYVEHMVEVFREVWRVLRPDGTVWLNLGDSYNGTEPRAANGRTNGTLVYRSAQAGTNEPTLKPKDLVMQPARVALALQDAGWWVRSDVIWHKTNPMPSSVDDRLTPSHEYVFLLSRAERYFYDDLGFREPAGESMRAAALRGERPAGEYRTPPEQLASRSASPNRMLTDADTMARIVADGRRARDVWSIPTRPYAGAHFATFPPDLVERCVRLGTPEHGSCPECGAPWRRIVERKHYGDWHPEAGSNGPLRVNAQTPDRKGAFAATWNRSPDQLERGLRIAGGQEEWAEYVFPVTVGWEPTCGCGTGLTAEDMEVILSPTGDGGAEDDSLVTGRAGFNRERMPDEGRRPMRRWEQRDYAEQLRGMGAETIAGMAEDYGIPETTMQHYIRTDRKGARAIPPDLLAKWIGDRYLTPPQRVVGEPPAPVPAVVLDPFGGSGTTGLVSQALRRRAILIDVNPKYVRQAIGRASRSFGAKPLEEEPVEQPEGSLWR
jgi:DNA modification methylase